MNDSFRSEQNGVAQNGLNEVANNSVADDVLFTQDISQKMNVSHRITIMGEDVSDESGNVAVSLSEQRHLDEEQEKQGFRTQMQVPVKLVVAGGGVDQSANPVAPVEMALEQQQTPAPVQLLSTPPSTLTLQQRSIPSVQEEFEQRLKHIEEQKSAAEDKGGDSGTHASEEDAQNLRAATSTATRTMQDPVGELVRMRRQMTRIMARMANVEAENEFLRRQQTLIIVVGCTYAAFFALKQAVKHFFRR